MNRKTSWVSISIVCIACSAVLGVCFGLPDATKHFMIGPGYSIADALIDLKKAVLILICPTCWLLLRTSNCALPQSMRRALLIVTGFASCLQVGFLMQDFCSTVPGNFGAQPARLTIKLSVIRSAGRQREEHCCAKILERKGGKKIAIKGDLLCALSTVLTCHTEATESSFSDPPILLGTLKQVWGLGLPGRKRAPPQTYH